MKNIFLHNRSLAADYRRSLEDEARRLIRPEEFPEPALSDTQKFYLEFKNRIQGFITGHLRGHQEAAGGEAAMPHLILLKQSALVDAAIRMALESAVWLCNRQHGLDGTPDRAPLAIIARGGYGREETFFCSNIDICILTGAPAGTGLDVSAEILRHFEYLFLHQQIFGSTRVSGKWEVGGDNPAPEIKQVAVLCAMMETRLVAGNPDLHGKFGRMIGDAVRIRRDEILAWFMDGKGLYEVQNTVFRQEPNLKEELRRLRWALSLARYKQSLDTINSFELLHELYTRNIVGAHAYKNTLNSLNFIARVRLLLHCLQKGSQRDILSYEVREKISTAMGYDLKKFYQQYFYNTVYPLKRHSRNLFWESLTQEGGPVRPLADSFGINSQNQIVCEGDPDEMFMARPELIFKVHSWVAEKGCYLSYPIIRAIERNAEQACPIFLNEDSQAQAQSYFKKIMRGKYFARALRLLHEFDLLSGYFIPEFKNLRGLLQDIYVHQYPTDMHILSALDELNRLEQPQDADPFLSGLYHSLKDKTALKLSVLLHDIGKGAKKTGENEELVGAKMIPGILGKLGYGGDTRRVENVAFLVQKHLMMRDLMLLDPEEEDTYEMVWDLVNYDTERLQLLILLTFADRSGTKMKMSPSQIEQLKIFYRQTLYRKKRESVAQHVKLEFLKMISLPWDMQDKLEVYSQFIKSRERFAAEAFYRPDRPCELVVCTHDQKGLLFKIAAVLAYNQLSIHEADIHTLDDKVLDVFTFQGPAHAIEHADFIGIRRKLIEDLRRIYVSREPLAAVYAGKSLPACDATVQAGGVKLKLSVIGRAVKLESADVLGTFMMQTRVFSGLDMEIQRAVLHTQHGIASNVFYLRAWDVERIMQNQDDFKEKMRRSLEQLYRGEAVFLDEAEAPASQLKIPQPAKKPGDHRAQPARAVPS